MLACCLAYTAVAQTSEKSEGKGYQFTDQIVIPSTAIENQNRSGTCWCYSTITMLECEILKAGGPNMRLSEMWIVRNSYMEKAEKYVRLHGHLNFGAGGADHDVTEGIKKYGIVPYEVYPGLNYGTDLPEFRELFPALKSYLDSVIKTAKKAKLTPVWKKGFNALLDTYFGPMPATFEYNGKTYTPKEFAASLPINMDDYVSFTSFTHHPFYKEFILEIPDNWMWATMWNVPLNELTAIVDNALNNGYTVEWGTDVSEKGFSRAKAIGVIPETKLENMSGTEAERWGQLTEKELAAARYKLDQPGSERKITQEIRQEAFDNYETQDDHGMVIVGTATDQIGNRYFKVQNSWGTASPYKGFYYFSRPFFEYKTTTIMVNRKAVPKEIAKKLGWK